MAQEQLEHRTHTHTHFGGLRENRLTKIFTFSCVAALWQCSAAHSAEKQRFVLLLLYTVLGDRGPNDRTFTTATTIDARAKDECSNTIEL